MASLQIGSPDELVLLGEARSRSHADEKLLHRMFAAYNLHGEWFSHIITEDILSSESFEVWLDDKLDKYKRDPLNLGVSFMQITIRLSGDKLLHATPAQFGAIVAHVVKSKKFHNVQVFKTMIAISFNLEDFTDLQALTDRATVLERDIVALLDLEPFPCPCGCGQFLAIGPCLVQANEMGLNGLTPEEIKMWKVGNEIMAIKMVRERTGCRLKDAKELVEAAMYNVSSTDQPF